MKDYQEQALWCLRGVMDTNENSLEKYFLIFYF